MDIGASSYRRYLDGDDNGLVEIIKMYNDGLTLFINGYVKNIFVAEDLTEDVFFKLAAKKPHFNGKSSFKTWLYAIGRNASLDYLRHTSKTLDEPIDNFSNYLSEENGVEKAYLIKERKIILHNTLKKLNDDYAHILYLIYFEGFNNKEAAKIMKKSVRQIENLIYRAKKALKEELKKEGFDYEEL